MVKSNPKNIKINLTEQELFGKRSLHILAWIICLGL